LEIQDIPHLTWRFAIMEIIKETVCASGTESQTPSKLKTNGKSDRKTSVQTDSA